MLDAVRNDVATDGLAGLDGGWGSSTGPPGSAAHTPLLVPCHVLNATGWRSSLGRLVGCLSVGCWFVGSIL
jgi:hypothetical protein